jgi:type IV secretion system protein VirB8
MAEKYMDWEMSLAVAESKSRRVAWIVASCACAVAVVQGIALAMLIPLHSVVPYVTQVDRVTGDSVILQTGTKTVGTDEMVDKHWVQSFVIARNRYVFKLLQADYDTVQLLSDGQTWNAYAAQFDGREAIDKKLGDTVEIIPSVLSISLSANGIATVRLQKETRNGQSSESQIQRYVATLRYEYAPKALAKESERVSNPFGFKVISYKMDQELVK